jgi:hypothetical protein
MIFSDLLKKRNFTTFLFTLCLMTISGLCPASAQQSPDSPIPEFMLADLYKGCMRDMADKIRSSQQRNTYCDCQRESTKNSFNLTDWIRLNQDAKSHHMNAEEISKMSDIIKTCSEKANIN